MNLLANGKIEIQKCRDGYGWRIYTDLGLGSRREDCLGFLSRWTFPTELDARTEAMLHQLLDRLWDLREPTAVFCLQSGQILWANDAHFDWLGHSADGCHHAEVLTRLIKPEHLAFEIYPAGLKVLGTYKILGATVERTDRAIKSRSGGVGYIRQCVRFKDFCNYTEPSQEVIQKLIALMTIHGDADTLLIAALNEVDRYQELNK
jgi:hypothetical protein